ncbi:hypothetical protein EJD96_16020 [Herbaspirillum seropedicae]|uniref:hypothetical protein n=1 Tax=Herbaspirillum seropedicae TaxID=964 RepID=UPI00111DC008|nr:hypothetical protein [Herbaspirillum seropedicae]QDD65555.1 hypothetical protein EJD96_16020 [Herbaspirillum seropedicae]
MTTIPKGAHQIIDARKRGMKPDELILVSLVGPVAEANHTVFVNPTGSYDWRWVIGLKLCLMVNEQTREAALDLLLTIGQDSPAQLHVWNVDQFKGARAVVLPNPADIEKPRASWRWGREFSPWSDFDNENFAWGRDMSSDPLRPLATGILLGAAQCT